MDRDDLINEDIFQSYETPDPGLIKALQVFQKSKLVEPHHNCDVSELLEYLGDIGGEATFYIKSDESGDIIGTIQVGYDLLAWRGFLNEIQVKIEFNTDLVELLYSDSEFQSLTEELGTEIMEASPKDHSIYLKITDDSLDEGIEKALQRAVELAEFFDSRISDEKDAEAFQEFIES